MARGFARRPRVVGRLFLVVRLELDLSWVRRHLNDNLFAGHTALLASIHPGRFANPTTAVQMNMEVGPRLRCLGSHFSLHGSDKASPTQVVTEATRLAGNWKRTNHRAVAVASGGNMRAGRENFGGRQADGARSTAAGENVLSNVWVLEAPLCEYQQEER